MALRSITGAYDGSPESVAALNEAVEIARKTDARLTLLAAVPLVSTNFGVALPAGEGAARMLESTRRALVAEQTRRAAAGVPNVETHVAPGDPVVVVSDLLERHSIDLLVLGSRRLSASGRFFLGSVSDGILHHARCSVLIVNSTTP